MPDRMEDYGAVGDQPSLPFDAGEAGRSGDFVEYDPRIREENWAPPRLPELRGFRFLYHGVPAELVDAGGLAGPTRVVLEPLSYWSIRLNGGRAVKVASTTCRRFVEEELARRAEQRRLESGVDDAPRTINDLIRAYHEQLHQLQDFETPDEEFEVFGVRAAHDQERRMTEAQRTYTELVAAGADLDTIRLEMRRVQRPSGRYAGNPRGNRRMAQAECQRTDELFVDAPWTPDRIEGETADLTDDIEVSM